MSMLVTIVVSLLLSQAQPSVSSPGSCPPPQFLLKDVEIKMYTGGGLESHEFSFSGSGQGKVVYRRFSAPAEVYAFAITDAEMLDLLNRVAKAYFFDLAEAYGHTTWFSQKVDGTVETSEITTVGGPQTGVTVRIGACQRHSMFASAGPPELINLASSLQDFAEARRRQP